MKSSEGTEGQRQGRSHIRNELSGSAGAVVQSGAVHGGVYVAVGDRREWQRPRQLPLDVPGFINRDRDLARLDTLLPVPARDKRASTLPIVVSAVAGAAGVGKTALVVHWAHRVRDQFPDGDLYVDLRGYGIGPRVTPEQALDGFLHSLDVPGGRIPRELGARAALFRSILDSRQMLVVLDNAASAEQVRPLLPASRSCLVVVTSRSRLAGLVAREGATRMVLAYLSPEESLRLLEGTIGSIRVAAEADAARQLAERCDNLPLALRIVAERAVAHPYMTLEDLLAELSDEQDRLDALEMDEDEVTAVRTVFSWSYRSLPPAVARAFRLLSLHVSPEFSTQAAAAVLGVRTTRAVRLLDTLHGLHLIEQTSRNRYRFHDLLRSYALERARAEESSMTHDDAIDRSMTWYLLTAHTANKRILPQGREIPLPSATEDLPIHDFPNLDAALEWCERERTVLLDVVRQAEQLGRYEIAWKLPIALMGFFERRSYWDDWIATHLTGLTAARSLGDRFGEGWVALSLADAYWDRREFDAAMRYFRQAVESTRECGDRWGEGFSLRGLSLVHQESGDFSSALTFAQQALSVFQEIDEERGKGMCFLSIGQATHGLGHPGSAIPHYESALAVFRRLGNSWSEALGLFRLGAALADLGRAASANDCLTRAASIFRSFGDRRHEAFVLDAIGDIALASGNGMGARTAWERALALLIELDDPSADRIRTRLAATIHNQP